MDNSTMVVVIFFDELIPFIPNSNLFFTVLRPNCFASFEVIKLDWHPLSLIALIVLPLLSNVKVGKSESCPMLSKVISLTHVHFASTRFLALFGFDLKSLFDGKTLVLFSFFPSKFLAAALFGHRKEKWYLLQCMQAFLNLNRHIAAEWVTLPHLLHPLTALNLFSFSSVEEYTEQLKVECVVILFSYVEHREQNCL